MLTSSFSPWDTWHSPQTVCTDEQGGQKETSSNNSIAQRWKSQEKTF